MILEGKAKWIALAAMLAACPAIAADDSGGKLVVSNLSLTQSADALDPFQIPVRSIGSLRGDPATNSGSPVHVRGTVVDQRLGEYIVVSDETGTLFTDTPLMLMPKVKELVDVAGTLAWDGSRFRLKNAAFRVAHEASSAPKETELASVKPAELPVLTRAWQIRDLTPERAAWKYPVRLRAVVTYYAHQQRLCVQDDLSGIYVRMERDLPELKVGDQVEVEGLSDPGQYAPIVLANRITIAGTAPLPEPRQVTVYQLASSQEGSQWIEVQGLAQSVTYTNGEVHLLLNDPTGRLPVTIPADHAPTNLLDALIRIRGVSASTFNSRRQFLGPTMLSPSLDYVQIEEPGIADPLSLPVQPVVSLSQFRPRLTLERRVNIAGVVTLCQPGQWFFLQDATDGVQVFTPHTGGIEPGHRVKAAGYPALGACGSVLRDAVCRVEGPGPVPQPALLTEQKPLDPQLHGRWVQADAYLLDAKSMGTGDALKLQFGSRVIEAVCQSSGSKPEGIRTGSRLRLTGVYQVLTDEARAPSSFQLLLPSFENVQVLAQPLWWTWQHTVTVLAIVAGALLIAALWIFVLRRQVMEQTRRLRDRFEREAALERRYQEIVGGANDIIFSMTIDGRLSSLNPAGLRILGYSAEEARDLQIDRLFAPESRSQVQDLCQGRSTANQIKDCEGQLLAKDGQLVPVEISARLAFKDNQPAGIDGIARDITERIRAKAALAEASSLLETLLENSPDRIYFKDSKSRFFRYSNAFAKLLNAANPEGLRGKTDFDFLTPEHAQAAYDDEQQIVRTGKPLIGKLEKESRLDGRVTWVLTTKMPWRDKNGDIVGTFGISKDVTAIKQAEEQLANERELFRALVESLPDNLFFKDRESRFVRLSNSKVASTLTAVRRLYLARHPAEASRELPPHLASVEAFGKYLIGKTDFDTSEEQFARKAFAEEQTIIQTGQSIIGKLEQINNPDGSTRWKLVSKMPWRDMEGNIIGTFGVSRDITALKEAEGKLEVVHQRLIETSRLAGMAEVATDVLHNVGNVLNSVNVSCSLTIDQVKASKVSTLFKVSSMLQENRGRLAEYLTRDPRGQQIPDFLAALSEHLKGEQSALLNELEQLVKHIDHIKQIVAMQQSYAKVAGVIEAVSPGQLVNDALQMNAAALSRHEVKVRRDFEETPPIMTEKHKVLQILVNLIRNAKYAMDDAKGSDKLLTIKVANDGANQVKIQVIDQGVGIPPENLTRIFAHGFTTRRNGHGFGLHSSALAVRELGGSLEAYSDGSGKGAIFTLVLPHTPPVQSAKAV